MSAEVKNIQVAPAHPPSMTKQKMIVEVGADAPEVFGCWSINCNPKLMRLLAMIAYRIFFLGAGMLVVFSLFTMKAVNYNLRGCSGSRKVTAQEEALSQLYINMYYYAVCSLVMCTLVTATIICLIDNSLRAKSAQTKPSVIMNRFIAASMTMQFGTMLRSLWVEKYYNREDTMIEFMAYGLFCYTTTMMFVLLAYKVKYELKRKTANKAKKPVRAPVYQYNDTNCIIIEDPADGKTPFF